jgi:co-chaperonin GroES (HSP10)
MKPSRYLDKFKKIADRRLVGDILFVEIVEEEEVKSKGGILMPTKAISQHSVTGLAPERRLMLVRVLQVGEGYYDDETKEDVPLTTKPGDIVAVPFAQVQWLSMFGTMEGYQPDSIGITTEKAIHWRLGTDAECDAVFEALNG